MKKETNTQCPFCQCSENRRVRRHLWMKFIPASKAYECSVCRGEFLTILGIFKIKVNAGYSKLINLQNHYIVK